MFPPTSLKSWLCLKQHWTKLAITVQTRNTETFFEIFILSTEEESKSYRFGTT